MTQQSTRAAEDDRGFSLMELAITVLVIGIIVAIAIPFFFNAQDSARQAAVETAARDGHVMARANILEGDPTGGDLSVLETDDVVLDFANSFVLGDESTVCVRADWVGQTENYAISGPCDESDTTVPIFDRDPNDPLYTQLTYQCPDTRTGYLGIVNVGQDTRVQIWEKDDREGTIREVFYGEPEEDFDLRFESRQEILRTRIVEETGGNVDLAYAAIEQAIEEAEEDGIEPADVPQYSMEQTIDNASEAIEMKGGVRYVVRFDGEVETFSAPGHRGHGETNLDDSLADCLVSIDHFGDDINLKNIVYLGGVNLSRVPENIPSSVRALRAAFENATHFNDPNISTWDVSNVHTMRSMFFKATSFNRPLNGWETDSLRYSEMMFNGATAFNQNLSSWNMSNAIVINRMFNEAESFNGNVSTWNTSNVVGMSRVFEDALSFNQDISSWDVSQVTNSHRFAEGSGLEEAHLPDFPPVNEEPLEE